MGIYPKELKAGAQWDSCMLMFLAALFTRAKNVEVTQVSTDRQMDKHNVA